jgi:hypothetical protein
MYQGFTATKGVGTEALHRDRIRDAQDIGFRYLVLLLDQVVDMMKQLDKGST